MAMTTRASNGGASFGRVTPGHGHDKACRGGGQKLWRNGATAVHASASAQPAC